jgi:hypothetical protein
MLFVAMVLSADVEVRSHLGVSACARKGSTFSQPKRTDHAEKGGAESQRRHN